MTDKKNIAAALVKAQLGMGKALKQTTNPHFRQKYADLGNVMDACLPALHEAGIAVIQPTGEDASGQYVETVLIHSGSGESLSCRVPLILQKNDMQGYGSAVTYARRYGLMTMAGIAPEDDDGNAAAKAAPKREAPQPKSEEQKPMTDAEKRDWLKAKIQNADDFEQLPVWWSGDKISAAVASLPEPMQMELNTLYNFKLGQIAPNRESEE